jgi:hypothetical protein
MAGRLRPNHRKSARRGQCRDSVKRLPRSSTAQESEGGRVLKKALVAVVAAGVMSVPLAGVAGADPPDNPGSQGQGGPENPGSQGKGPGAFGGAPGIQVRDFAKEDGSSVPDAINNSTEFGRIGPGLIVKSFTPGCDKGKAPVPCAEESTTSN